MSALDMYLIIFITTLLRGEGEEAEHILHKTMWRVKANKHINIHIIIQLVYMIDVKERSPTELKFMWLPERDKSNRTKIHVIIWKR